jgi:hypothetical protein
MQLPEPHDPADDVVEFWGQRLHAALPISFLYLPMGQIVHSPPSGPVYPLAQTQLLCAVDAVNKVSVLAGQLVHKALP